MSSPGLLLAPPKLAIGLLLAASVAAAAPPRVIKAVPDNGDADVNPALKEIRITFDQDMSRTGHSLCGGGPNFPEVPGKPRWTNKRTIIIPVKLKPGHEYSLSINCPVGQNFRSASGEPAEVYPISFKTSAAGAKPTGKLTASQNRKAVDALRSAIDQKYSYRDLRGVDWDKLFAEYEKKLIAAKTPAEFARTAARLLAAAKDVHITLRSGDATFASHRRSVAPNCDLRTLAARVPNFEKHNDVVATGRFDDAIGYILISTWQSQSPDDLKPAYESLSALGDARGLIVNVRPNAGGDELTARHFAGCFMTRPAVYSKNTYRDPKSPDGFGKPAERVVKPNKDKLHFPGRVAVLTGPANMSSCESFLLMMRQSPQCKLFGERSYGSSGNPKPFDLGNGVTVFLSSWRDMQPDGALIEGNGIEPDVEVAWPRGDRDDADPVLDAALKWLRESSP